MIKESLLEFLLIAEYSIKSKKPNGGCYGYPANILLFSVADIIGSYVIGGKTKKHFDILNHKEYYNLSLEEEDLKKIYEAYRCLGTHNGVLGGDVVLSIGRGTDDVFLKKNEIIILNLVPFLELTKKSVGVFLARVNKYVPCEVKKG